MKLTPNQRLRQLRHDLNMSQDAFGKLLGLKQGSFSDIERGKVNVSPSVLRKLDQLGFNPTWIQQGEGSIRKSKHSDVNERIMAIIESLGYKNNLNSLAQRMDIPLKEFSFLKTDGILSELFMNKFFETFTQVNRIWVMENKGPMFNVDTQQVELMRQELSMVKCLLTEKEQLLAEKNQLIANLYRQIDLLQSFIPVRGQ